MIVRCTHCKTEKSRDDFQKSRSTKTGLQLWCKACIKVANDRRRSDPTHRAHDKAQRERYAKSHRDIYRKAAIKYNQSHPATVRLNAATRRRRISESVSRMTEAEWQETLQQFGYRCAYCGCGHEKLTMEHMTPVSRGGDDSQSNIVPACMACNLHKHVRGVIQMVNVPWRGQVSN